MVLSLRAGLGSHLSFFTNGSGPILTYREADEFTLMDTVNLVGFVCLSVFVLSVTVLGVEAIVLG